MGKGSTGSWSVNLTPDGVTCKFCRLQIGAGHEVYWRFNLEATANLRGFGSRFDQTLVISVYRDRLAFIPAASKHRAPWCCAPPTVHSQHSSTVRLLKCQSDHVPPTFQWIRIKSKALIVVLKTLVAITQGTSPSSPSTIPHCSLSSFLLSFPS